MSAAIVTVPVVLSTTPSIATVVSAPAAPAADSSTAPTPVTVPSTSRSPADEASVTVPPAFTEPAAATVTSPMVPKAAMLPVAPKFPPNVTVSASSTNSAPTSPSASSTSASPVADNLSVLPPSTSPRMIPAAAESVASMSTMPLTSSLASVVKPTPDVFTEPALMLSVKVADEASRSSSPSIVTTSSSMFPLAATTSTPTPAALRRSSFRSMSPCRDVSVRPTLLTVTGFWNVRSASVVMSLLTTMAFAPYTVVLPSSFS